MKSERLDFIQALRGIAAMAVVLFHARGWINGPVFDDAGELFKNGVAGVDLFFVVSGFIMVHATWRLGGGPRDALQFLAKRFARIWPVYVVTTIVFVVAADNYFHWFATPNGLIGTAKAFVFYPLAPTSPPFFGYTPNGVGWTLDYEMWFYVLFAISLVFVRYRWLALCSLFVAFLVVVPLLLGDRPLSLNAYTNYGMSVGLLNLAASPFIWEFLAGVGIGILYRSGTGIRNRVVLVMLVVLAVTLVLLQQSSTYAAIHGMTGFGPALVLMVLVLSMKNREFPFRVPRWLCWLGDVSFSLYLVHRIPQVVIARIVPSPQDSFVLGAGCVLATVALALVLAQLSYRYLERGLAEAFRRWLVKA